MLRSVHARAMVVLLALLLPTFVWIALDKRLWPWDQAWYGQNTVELFYTLRHTPLAWPDAMTRTLFRQAPAIAWGGQFFVPIGVALGSIDIGLLLSIVATEAAMLYLVYRTAWDASGGSRSAALTAMIVAAAAPLTAALSHYYVVETGQAAAVAWFALVAVRAPSWPRLMTAGQLLLATAFAMLTKVSSPVFCILPGLVAVYYIVRPASAGRPLVGSRVKTGLALLCGVVLTGMTLAWYANNLRNVVGHVRLSSSGAVAELYGGRLAYFASLREWLVTLPANLLSPLSAVLCAMLVLIAIGRAIVRWRAPGAGRGFGWIALLAGLEMAIVLVVFSFSSNREGRYLLPLIPYIALIVAWTVWQLRQRAITLTVIAAFLLQWGQSHAIMLGLIAPFPDTPNWMDAYSTNRANQQIAQALVKRTCTAQMPRPARNAVGVQLLGLNPPALDYESVKTFLPAREVPCQYDPVAYFETDVDHVWQRVRSRPLTHYIAFDPKLLPAAVRPLDKAVNMMNEPILRRVEQSGEFVREPDLAEDTSVWIFTHVGTIADRVLRGRALTDLGQHDRAIAVLREAAADEPANVEAWANLALAYERAGRLDEALKALERARQLNAQHYYVNLGMARVLLAQGQQAFAARDTSRGCERLQRAREVEPGDREILAALSSHSCASVR